MRHFAHHIGDYDAATAHLTWAEDMAYTRLLRAYYRDEKPIPGDINAACRLARAKTKAERDAVQTVLLEFFTLNGESWINKRAEVEIEAYHEKAAKASRSAQARWERCERNANAMLESDANASSKQCQPITNNHEPLTNDSPDGESKSNTLISATTIYRAYPRKVGLAKAIKAIEAALKKTTFEELLEAVQAFAKSPAGQAGSFTPYPATWFNQERWTDDRREWNRIDNGRPGQPVNGPGVTFVPGSEPRGGLDPNF